MENRKIIRKKMEVPERKKRELRKKKDRGRLLAMTLNPWIMTSLQR